MKKTFIPVAVALAVMTLSTNALAYGPTGPFQTVSELSAEWASFSPGSAAYVYVDNTLVYSRGGFGPAAQGSYVTCSDSRIHQGNCTTVVPTAVICNCEHFGSQFDGRCEVEGYPTPLNGDETFFWTPHLQAFIVWSEPFLNFAVYDVVPGTPGSLNVQVNFSNGQSLSTLCGNGTVGFGN